MALEVLNYIPRRICISSSYSTKQTAGLGMYNGAWKSQKGGLDEYTNSNNTWTSG